MSKVSYIPKDYNSVYPLPGHPGAAQAIEYYRKFSGAAEVFRMNGPDARSVTPVKIGNSHIMLAEENPGMGQGTPARPPSAPVR